MEDLVGRIFTIVACLYCILIVGVQHLLLKTYILYRLKHSYSCWWVDLGEPKLWQLTEFSDDFVMLSMDTGKMEAINKRGDSALSGSLKAYGKIQRVGEYMLVIALALIPIFYGLRFLGELFAS
jgi:hypothetical protein